MWCIACAVPLRQAKERLWPSFLTPTTAVLEELRGPPKELRSRSPKRAPGTRPARAWSWHFQTPTTFGFGFGRLRPTSDLLSLSIHPINSPSTAFLRRISPLQPGILSKPSRLNSPRAHSSQPGFALVLQCIRSTECLLSIGRREPGRFLASSLLPYSWSFILPVAILSTDSSSTSWPLQSRPPAVCQRTRCRLPKSCS
jgi:hypothetical protein